ncbi:MAG: SseB family protein [Rhodobacteraceae bacterium]|nr:SseB family protein [Paracoccaceae bacterium]
MTETPLDRSHAAMEAAPEAEVPRLRFFDALAGAELFLLLEAEAEGEAITPRLFPAAVSGRALAPMLAGAGLGLALNPEVAPSATFLPPEAMRWLAETLAERPAEVEARPVAVSPPDGLPEALLAAIDAKLATATGLARHAWLAAVAYGDGREGHLLAFVDALEGAEAGLARAMGEALTFSGVEAGEIDVAFFRASDPVMARIAKVGLRFDIPAPDQAQAPSAPGMDPARPPRLR